MDKANWVKFFEETFLIANISLGVVFGMSFLTLSGADGDFLGRELRWKTYTIEEALPTIRCIELVDRKEFAAATLDLEHETYVIYVGSVSNNALLSSSLFNIHPSWRSQISGLIAEKVSTKFSAKYSNFADVFFPDFASEFLKHTEINNHAIKLVNGQQPPYRPIYNLEPVELKTLKAYIETNLANDFIRLSKSSASAPIVFDQKSNGSL